MSNHELKVKHISNLRYIYNLTAVETKPFSEAMHQKQYNVTGYRFSIFMCSSCKCLSFHCFVT